MKYFARIDNFLVSVCVAANRQISDVGIALFIAYMFVVLLMAVTEKLAVGETFVHAGDVVVLLAFLAVYYRCVRICALVTIIHDEEAKP